MRPRTRDCGIIIGALPTGAHNAITDVPGVKVGHSTLIEGEGPLIAGAGPVRTGVTAIWPHSGDLFYEKVAACVHTINGFCEVTNSDQVREMGVVEGPILITNTLNVPRVADYAIDWAFEHYPQMGITDWGISPVVAETSDMVLNDIRGRHVQREHVFAAIDGATAGPVEEGSIGGGTGMSCLGFKGGIGTASSSPSATPTGSPTGQNRLSTSGARWPRWSRASDPTIRRRSTHSSSLRSKRPRKPFSTRCSSRRRWWGVTTTRATGCPSRKPSKSCAAMDTPRCICRGRPEEAQQKCSRGWLHFLNPCEGYRTFARLDLDFRQYVPRPVGVPPSIGSTITHASTSHAAPPASIAE